MKRVLFLCTSGICRSPMAEHILKHKLKQKGVEVPTNHVMSVGLMATPNEKTSTKSIDALKTLKISARRHNSKQLSKKLVSDNTIIIAMTKQHKAYVQNMDVKVYTFSDFDGGIDVEDPYGQSQEVYNHTAKLIDFMMDEVVEKLLKNEL